MRILLVSPRRGSDFARDDFAGTKIAAQFPLALMPPLDLATIKALTPPHIEVDIWDESVKGRIDDSTDLGRDYDLFGVTGYMTHIPWAIEFAKVARLRKVPAVIGGPGVSGAPERCRGVFDVVFIGEAEFTWPQFLEDFESGTHRSEYRQVQRPDIDLSPAPLWDDIPNMVKDYLVGPVQTTRGCPFDCEFCDVIHLFGRQPRHKSVSTVLAEVEALQALGMRRITFCDDNFIGEPKYTKELLRGLMRLNHSFERPLSCGAQVTLNVARDDELLELLADCNFGPMTIGVESPREASLREANKPQNYRTDILADIRKIHSYGIAIAPTMIVGFDADDKDIFNETYEFVQAACTPNPNVYCLKAYPGTPLLARLLPQRRVIDISENHFVSHAQALSNIIPKQMTRIEMLGRFKTLHENIRDWDNFGDRVKGFLRSVKRMPNISSRPAPEAPDPQAVMLFMEFLATLEPNAQKVIGEIFAVADQHAPWLKPRVVGFVVYQAGFARTLSKLGGALQERIDMESAPGYEPPIVERRSPVPLGFKLAMQKEAFPTVYRHIRDGLEHQALVTEALIRVWKDFLTRWSETFERFEDYHHEHLRELCVRYIEQGNSGAFDDSRVYANTDDLNGVQLRRLAGEVLVSVVQDLQGAEAFAPASQLVDLEVPNGRSGEPA